MNPFSRVGGPSGRRTHNRYILRSDGHPECMFFKTLCEFAGLQSLSCLNSLRNIANNTFKGFLLCAWGCAHTVQGFVCVHDVLSVFLQKLSILPFESWSHTGTWASTIRLCWMSSESPGSACLCLPRNWIPSSYHQEGIYTWVPGIKLRSSCFWASTLSTEPFPQPCSLKDFQVFKTFGCLVACLFCSPTEYIQLSKLKIVRI